MTIVVSAEETVEQIAKRLDKLINVVRIVEQDGHNSVARELALIKVRADAGTRSQVIEAVNLFRAKVIDVSPESLTVKVTVIAEVEGAPPGTGALRRPEIVPSSMVSLSRGPRGIGTPK